jgi:hypothetical protein
MYFRSPILSNRMLGSLYRHPTVNKPQSCANNSSIYCEREFLQKTWDYSRYAKNGQSTELRPYRDSKNPETKNRVYISRSEKAESSRKSHSNSQKSHHSHTRRFPSRLFTCLLIQMLIATNSDNIESHPSVRIRRFYLSISGRPRNNINFNHHPIAPLGCKVLTWDSPDNRGSLLDHGIEAIYIGPALDHFRAFNVWISTYSASRVTNTVWWFMRPIKPSDDLLQLDPNIDPTLLTNLEYVILLD